LQLEALEERNLLTVSVIENFASGNLNAYRTVLRALPSAQVLPIAAHDDLKGLDKQDGYEWIMRNDAAVQFQAGQTISVWVKFADVADGRAYFGFDARPNGLTHSPLGQGGGLALVLAPNTNQLILQKITSTPGSTSAGFNHTNLAAVPQSYVANQWYRVEVSWSATGNTFTGRLYGSTGIGLPLNTVTATTTPQFPQGGISFRALGHDKYFDTVVLDTDSTGTVEQRANAGGGLDPSWTPGDPPQPVANQPNDGSLAPVPWRYTATPGTGIDITLNSFNQLQQATIIGDTVGLAAANNSLNTGTVQVGWGPPASGPFNDGTPIETPLLAQYLFRQRPGEITRLIGASDVKHFFSSAQTEDTHFLNPTQNDTYGSGLNMNQQLYTAGSEIDPATGTLHDPVDFGHRNNDGQVVGDPRSFTNSNQYLLQVKVADLDHAQNPAGTRWFLMGNLFVGGDQNVANNSRWVEVTPIRNPVTGNFSFDYPNGSGGQLNFRTIPGLVAPAGPYVIAQTPAGDTFGSVSSVQVRFDGPINPSTFTPDSITSFTQSVGSTVTDLLPTIIGVNPVFGSGNTRFDISFASQTALGVYQLVFGPNIQDLAGHPMDQNQNGIAGEFPDDQYTATFSIQGPRIIASTPSGNVFPAAQTSSVRLTFNEPINPATFTRDLAIVRGPNGGIPVNSVTPVAGSNNTQFDVGFATQTTTGHYTLLILPYLRDMFGHQLDQNGNFIDGEVPDDIAVLTFGILGPSVVSAAPNSTAPGEVFSLRVTFNEPIDVASFTPSQVVSFTGPNGPINVVGVSRVGSGPNYTQFDLVFPTQTTAGTYTVVLSQDIRDVFGNKMDQNGNLIPGENPGDRATVQFTINGPRIIASTPSGSASPPVSIVRVTFDTPIIGATFTTDQVVTSDPAGNPINVTNVEEVPFTNHTQFNITFDAQRTPGRYTLVIGPNIQDVYGNLMDNAATVQFTITINYTATVTTFQNIEIFGQPGTQTLHFRSGDVVADDDFGTISLGSNSFNFYGTTYTQLFASSNGLITFGTGNSDYHATNLRGSPPQAAIAVYWTDLIKTGTEPMIVWRIDGNQLIVEWYRVSLYDDRTVRMTFEAIMDLNTGGRPGNIVLNYSSVTGTGDGPEDNGVTVGVKDAGTATDVSRTLVEDGTHFSSTGDPRVQSGRALLIAPDLPGGGDGSGGSGGGGVGGSGGAGNANSGSGSAPWQPLVSVWGSSSADSSKHLPGSNSVLSLTGSSDRATDSIDQFFAFTKGGDQGFALFGLRHRKLALAEWQDALAIDDGGGSVL
jgi:hypothetical protein